MARTFLSAGRIVAGRTTDVALPAYVPDRLLEQVQLRHGTAVTIHRVEAAVPTARTAA